jgi:hypothetical protein
MHDIVRRAGRFIVSPVFKFQFQDSRSRSTMKQSATVSGCHARAALPACVFGHASMPWSRASQSVHRMRARFAEPPQVFGQFAIVCLPEPQNVQRIGGFQVFKSAAPRPPPPSTFASGPRSRPPSGD